MQITFLEIICIFFLLNGTWNFRFLQQSLRNKSLQMNDYKIALLCNAYSTNSECFTLPMGALVETIYGNGIMRIPLPGTSCLASGSITPLPMNLLDSLTVHAKMRYVLSYLFRPMPGNWYQRSKDLISWLCVYILWPGIFLKTFRFILLQKWYCLL